MSKRKSLGMGGDPSQRMFITAKELLWRQRVIHQFPVDRDDVIVSLLPPEAQDLVLNLGKSFTDYQWKNLTQCVTFNNVVLIELDGDMEQAFWFKFKRLRPTPNGNNNAFQMDRSNRHYSQVLGWHKAASVTHKRLLCYEQALFSFFSRADHPVLVEKYWPELHNFVDFELAPNQKLSDASKNKRRIVPMPTDEQRNGIIETLAGSTLLESHECNTWVDYETEG